MVRFALKPLHACNLHTLLPPLHTRLTIRRFPCAQFFCLQLTIGIRDQSTLSLSWTLLATVMICGLATEAWSRPAQRDADGYRGWVGDPPRTPEIMNLVSKKRAWSHRNYHKRPEAPTTYDYEQTLSGLSARERWEYENQPDPPAPNPLTYSERLILRDYARAYTANYLYRLIPHFIGWVPYLVVWYQYFFHFVNQLNDLKLEDEDLFDRVPDFVPWAVGATCIWFTSFTFVQVSASLNTANRVLYSPCVCARCSQWRYQYVSPGTAASMPHTPAHTLSPLTPRSQMSTTRPSGFTASSRRAPSSHWGCFSTSA